VRLQAEEGSLAAYFWRYEVDPKSAAARKPGDVSAQAVAIARDLKKRGWRFVGPTTIFAFMQATGLVNDHAKGCAIGADVTKRR
jgi:DNA-3-methyladenine glycosylase I